MQFDLDKGGWAEISQRKLSKVAHMERNENIVFNWENVALNKTTEHACGA
jgi:hypothetical protein